MSLRSSLTIVCVVLFTSFKDDCTVSAAHFAKHNGQDIVFFNVPADYHMAKHHCANFSMHLVHVVNQSVHQVILDNIDALPMVTSDMDWGEGPGDHGYWVSGIYSVNISGWQWDNGVRINAPDSAGFQRWFGNEPDENMDGVCLNVTPEDRLDSYTGVKAGWKDDPCEMRRYYICEGIYPFPTTTPAPTAAETTTGSTTTTTAITTTMTSEAATSQPTVASPPETSASSVATGNPTTDTPATVTSAENLTTTAGSSTAPDITTASPTAETRTDSEALGAAMNATRANVTQTTGRFPVSPRSDAVGNPAVVDNIVSTASASTASTASTASAASASIASVSTASTVDGFANTSQDAATAFQRDDVTTQSVVIQAAAAVAPKLHFIRPEVEKLSVEEIEAMVKELEGQQNVSESGNLEMGEIVNITGFFSDISKQAETGNIQIAPKTLDSIALTTHLLITQIINNDNDNSTADFATGGARRDVRQELVLTLEALTASVALDDEPAVPNSANGTRPQAGNQSAVYSMATASFVLQAEDVTPPRDVVTVFEPEGPGGIRLRLPASAVARAWRDVTRADDDVTADGRKLRTAFTYFRSAELFPSPQDSAFVAISAVIGGSFVSDKSNVAVENLEDPVEISFPLEVTQLRTPSTSSKQEVIDPDKRETIWTCAYWKFGEGIWSPDGCELNHTLPDTPVCLCNHLTSFSLIVTEQSAIIRQSSVDTTILDIASFFSVVFLLLIIEVHLRCRDEKNWVPFNIILNICGNLAFVTSLFLVALVRAAANHDSCLFFTVTLHFFALTSWAWITCLVLHVHTTVVRKTIMKLNRRVYALAYGLPFLIVTLNAAVAVGHFDNVWSSEYEDYGYLSNFFHRAQDVVSKYMDNNTCWLTGNSNYFGFLAPVICVVIFNVCDFTAVFVQLRRTTAENDKQRRNAVDHSVLFVHFLSTNFMIWIFATVLTISESNSTMSASVWLMAICVLFQGTGAYCWSVMRRCGLWERSLLGQLSIACRRRMK